MLIKLLVTVSILLSSLSATGCACKRISVISPQGGVSPVSGRILPPEPDPAVNKATIAGVDSNNDGLRDDVERWLDATYGVDKKKLSGVRKYARERQKDIAEIELITQDTRLTYSKNSLKAIDCFLETHKDESWETQQGILEIISQTTFNTLRRIKIKHESDKKFSGLLTGLSKTEEAVKCAEE